MAKRKKLKKPIKIGIILIILFTIISIIGIKYYQDYLYKQTYEYKLLELNYTIDDSKILIKNLNDNELSDILSIKQNNNIVNLVSEKYFIYNNLERYLAYIEKHDSKDYSKSIAVVNVNQDRNHYEEPIKTNLEDEILMLVNKYYYLEENYTPSDIIKISSQYSYEGNSISEIVVNAFKELSDDAKLAGHTIVINSSYRDYLSQKNVWETRKNLYGTKKADAYAARPGHSEHQTGYAIDVADFYDVNDKFGETESFIWMAANCHKYGFILRYPKDQEYLTGYAYEPWHYRYVGKEVANIVKQENITFDEYYAYYIDKNK